MRAGGLGGFKSFIDGQEPQDESQTALLINKKTKLDLKRCADPQQASIDARILQ